MAPQVISQIPTKDIIMKGGNGPYAPQTAKVAPLSPPAVDALRGYGQRFGGDFKVQKSQPEDKAEHNAPAVAEIIAQATKVPSEAHLCTACQLPLGESCCDSRVHGECKALLMLEELRKSEEAKRSRDLVEKKETRSKYGIGWDASHIPSNVDPVFRLSMKTVPEGMVCLVLTEEDGVKSMKVAATTEPAAAVNLEYLSTALRIRRLEGREPYFSLNPVDASQKHSMQKKVFAPEWLARTKAGEVLFQADYYLKELSMGEYQQPVVGMQSGVDYSETEGRAEAWSAREWFMIRKAEITMSDSNVLIPYVKMGVEAREQQRKGDIMEDVPITRPDHPMVQFAEDFTKNFDLIAERRSVIYHLRDLAKATALAKFVQQSELGLTDTWFRLAENSMESCIMEIPQLWNQRIHSQIQVRDGAVVYERGQGSTIQSSSRGIYGGVSLNLPQLAAMQLRKKAPDVAALIEAKSVVPRVFQVSIPVDAPASGLLAQMAYRGLQLTTKVVPASALVPIEGEAAPVATKKRPARAARGVDLSLDNLDLSVTKDADDDIPEQTPFGDSRSLESCLAVGKEFWSVLEGREVTSKIFKEEDKALLKELFNPSLTDRRSEGDRFVPPDGRSKYVKKLHNLLKDESELREKRISHFLSTAFVMGGPGSLFPCSWTPKAEIVNAELSTAMAAEGRPQGALQKLVDKTVAAQVLQQTTPTFDKTTEDGLRFRIYQLGSLEARTTQEYNGSEQVNAVFSVRNQSQAPADSWDPWDERVPEQELLVKATVYVEKTFDASLWQYFAVLETASGHKLVTEQRRSGETTWSENVEDLEDRISIAKVFMSSDCRAGTIVRQLRQYQNSRSAAGHAAPLSICEQYARGACRLASGLDAAKSK